MITKNKHELNILLVVSILVVLILSIFFSLVFNMSFFIVLFKIAIGVFGIELFCLLILFLVYRRLFGFLKMIKPIKNEAVDKVILKVFAVFLFNWIPFFIFGYDKLDGFLMGIAGFIVILIILQIKKYLDTSKQKISIYLAVLGIFIVLFGIAMILTSLMSIATEDIRALLDALKLIF